LSHSKDREHKVRERAESGDTLAMHCNYKSEAGKGNGLVGILPGSSWKRERSSSDDTIESPSVIEKSRNKSVASEPTFRIESCRDCFSAAVFVDARLSNDRAASGG
jgi:hypothetical protein